MWRASAKLAFFVMSCYAAFVIVEAWEARNSERSMIILVLPLLPIAWIFLAGCLWLCLRLAGIFTDPGTAVFVLIAGLIGFIFANILNALWGGSFGSWIDYALAPFYALGQGAAAVMAAPRKRTVVPK